MQKELSWTFRDETVMGSNVAFIEKWICSEIDDCIPGNVEVARNGLDTR